MKRFFILTAILLGCTVAFAQNKTVIVQVSDTQFGFWNDEDISYEVGTYSKCIEELNVLKPDAVVLTGDLVNHSWVEKQWEALFEITGRLDKDIPVFFIPGNHDENFHNGEIDSEDYFKHMKYSRFAKVIGDTYLIGIDSNPIKDCFGSKTEEEQFKWLKKMLRKNRKHRTTIIFTHTPFFLEHFDEENGYFQMSKEARKKYFDLFKKYNVKGVFSGHLHQNRVASYENTIPVVTTSAIGVQLGKDHPGYRIITVTDGQLTHEYVDVNMENATYILPLGIPAVYLYDLVSRRTAVNTNITAPPSVTETTNIDFR